MEKLIILKKIVTMLNKYRLIKTYPGSPKLNTILIIDSSQETGYYSENSEFWEEIVEKDYEILEIQGKYGGISSYKEQYNSDLKDKSIYKIIRLSDKEIFTIGDKTNNGTISKFEANSNVIRVFFEEKHKNYHVNLNSINYIKQPLFTTEQRSEIEEIIKNINSKMVD